VKLRAAAEAVIGVSPYGNQAVSRCRRRLLVVQFRGNGLHPQRRAGRGVRGRSAAVLNAVADAIEQNLEMLAVAESHEKRQAGARDARG
jgi:hypothetical protein